MNIEIPNLKTESEYIGATETAAILRARLKSLWPQTKFSVKTSKYAGGASIDVQWTGGPLFKEVDAECRNFSGAGFDGMIDLKYNRQSWLYPDGSTSHAYCSGTSGSIGPTLRDPVKPGGRLVDFGADYVMLRRVPTASEYWSKVAEFEFWTGCEVRHHISTYPTTHVGHLWPILRLVSDNLSIGDEASETLYHLQRDSQLFKRGEAPEMHELEAGARTLFVLRGDIS